MMHTLVVSKSDHVSVISSYKTCAACVVIAFLLINELNCTYLPWSKDVTLQNENKPWDGNQYWFKFKTLFGISRSEKGTLKTSDKGKPYIDVEGQITYPIAGYLKNIHYKADDKGFDILKMTIQHDTNKNTPNIGPHIGPNIGPHVGPNIGPHMGPNIGPKIQKVHGYDGDKILFPIEYGVTDTDNTIEIPEDGEGDYRYGEKLPPDVLASLIGG